MSCMWGRTPPRWSILLLNNDYCSSKWSKDWLNRFKTRRKTDSFYKKSKKSFPLAKVWASQRRKVHDSLSCSWTPTLLFFFFFYRGAGRWWRWQLGELVTGFRSQVVFTETSEQRGACQAAQYLPCNTMLYCSIHAFSRTEAPADERRETFTKDSHPNVQHGLHILVQISVLMAHISIFTTISSRMLHYRACPGADSWQL